MELTQLEKQFLIQSSASFAEAPTHVLKDGDTFAIFDQHGDFAPVGNQEQGLYHNGTRFLSHATLTLFGRAPALLQAGVRRDNSLLTVDLTNPDCNGHNGYKVPHGTLHLFRAKMLFEGALYEHLRVRSYAAEPLDVSFSLSFDADFADIFELRGTTRDQRGERLPTEKGDGEIVLGYRGLDDEVRRSRITCSPTPKSQAENELRFEVTLGPQEHFDVYTTVRSEDADSREAQRMSYQDAKESLRGHRQHRLDQTSQISTSNQQFDAWLTRSLSDLNMLITRLPEGLYPYAGIPWFSTVFGRDGLLTALMSLWVNPQIARGVLAHLAATQADMVDEKRDAQPGKILHEARGGEMAALREVPFGRYYGSVDSTPLFVALAGRYLEHTGDQAFIEEIWPNIEAALRWIDEYADVDDDGFIEYWKISEDGLAQQGWKDSHDSVFHEDGTMAEPPIALCEAQAYVYDAKRQAADMAAALGKTELAERLSEQADSLRDRFREAFWMEDLGTFALALDGENRQCRVRSSNAGHVLLSGIASDEQARRVVETLFADDSFCGWGIRTLSSQERRYNPMAYHNGSIWPHDNAVIGAGLGRYGFRDEVQQLMGVFFDASTYDPIQRLPELFCGFNRQPGEGPTRYPVACSPQAWATVVVFQLLQSSLGLQVHANRHRISLHRPALPDFLQHVTIRNLRVGESRVDLKCQRYERNVGVEVLKCEGTHVEVEILI